MEQDELTIELENDNIDIVAETEDDVEVEIEENVTSINVEKYKGKYNITPLAFQQQELQTKDKFLEENVIVKEVPFFEVSNAEGITIYIGSEV